MKRWESYWKHTNYEPIVVNPIPSLYGGTNTEPLASIGMSCFLDAIRPKFKEGFSVLDYGCGAGILANFISERLEDFTYYGLEPNTDHGISRIELGKTFFKDKRINFGIIERDFLEICKSRLDCIVLISIFTHMQFEDIEKTLDKLIKVFTYNPDCSIIFSCFIENSSICMDHLPEIWERFYGKSCITVYQLESYFKDKNLKLERHMNFVAAGNHVHEIYKVTKL